jgi:hypothetical protein
MIRDVIEKLFSTSVQKHRFTLLAQTSENTLINIMKQVPSDIELSSLPILKDAKASVEISLLGEDKLHVEKYFKLFSDYLEDKNIKFNLI